MQPFFKMAAPYLMFDCTRNVFEVPSRNEDGSAPRLLADAFEEGLGSLIDMKELATEILERSAAVERHHEKQSIYF